MAKMLQVIFCLDGWDCQPFAPKPNDYQKVFPFVLYLIAQNYLHDYNCHVTFRKSLSCINCVTNLNILKLQKFLGSLLNTTPFQFYISFHSILKKENKKNVCNDLTKDSSIILWNVLGFPSFVTWASTPCYST